MTRVKTQSPTWRQRIAAFFQPTPAPILAPTDLEVWAAPYIAAGWQTQACYFPQHRQWLVAVSMETQSSGCETITCQHTKWDDTLSGAMEQIDALGVVASPAAVPAEATPPKEVQP